MFMKHGEMTGNLAVLRVIFCARWLLKWILWDCYKFHCFNLRLLRCFAAPNRDFVYFFSRLWVMKKKFVYLNLFIKGTWPNNPTLLPEFLFSLPKFNKQKNNKIFSVLFVSSDRVIKIFNSTYSNRLIIKDLKTNIFFSDKSSKYCSERSWIGAEKLKFFTPQFDMHGIQSKYIVKKLHKHLA
jgi:hypothetical protein